MEGLGSYLGLSRCVRPPETEETCSGTGFTRPTGTISVRRPYAVMIHPGEKILLGAGRRCRVLDVVPFDEEDESPFVDRLGPLSKRRSAEA